MKKSSHAGFTLVELAIVLLIIGLVAGGIMMGSGMIRNAEVQSLGEDFQKYESAINHFKDTYDALPGDFATATMQWGTLATCPTGEANGTKETCDGNDNSRVDGNEYARVWQHLANADMIEGAYTGANPYNITPNKDAPAARMDNAVFAMGQCDDGFINAYGAGDMFIAVTQAHSACGAAAATLTPGEAFMLDSKFDDGAPHIGTIVGNNQGGSITPDCVTSDDMATGQYAATNPRKVCAVAYRISIDDGSVR